MKSPAPKVTVTFTDPTGQYTSQTSAFIANAEAAFQMWAEHLAPSIANLAVNFHLVEDYPNRGGGSSVASAFLRTVGGIDIFDSGAAYELRTGIDPNGAAPDIDVFFDVDFLTGNYWIDPLDGTPPPSDKNDLVFVIAHELGHALGFNGWRSSSDYTLPGNYQSVFDSLVSTAGGYPYFNGAHAESVYGEQVPLTAGNLFHLGNAAPGPGSDLVPDLMNGVVFGYDPYAVSALDVAILSDLGVPTELGDILVDGDEADTTFGGLGNDVMLGGGGNDVLNGGPGKDRLEGDDGADKLIGGKGKDVFVFVGQGDSDVAAHDTIGGFDASTDRVELWFKVRGVDNDVNGGALTAAHFADDLESALAGTHLKGHHAVLFRPDSGNFSGKVILAVDVNGTNGFQADDDLVMVLQGALHLDDLGKRDFTSAIHDLPVAEDVLAQLPHAPHLPMSDAFDLF